jgi:hypothetical protein
MRMPHRSPVAILLGIAASAVFKPEKVEKRIEEVTESEEDVVTVQNFFMLFGSTIPLRYYLVFRKM